MTTTPVPATATDRPVQAETRGAPPKEHPRRSWFARITLLVRPQLAHSRVAPIAAVPPLLAALGGLGQRHDRCRRLGWEPARSLWNERWRWSGDGIGWQRGHAR